MKKKQNPRIKSIFFLTFFLLFCGATAGMTADHIQLRKYPSPDALLLDTIPKGQKVKVIETFGSWRYILVKGSTYGGGWVHFKDLEKGHMTDPKAKAGTKLSKADVQKAPSPKRQDRATKKHSSQGQRTDSSKNKQNPSFQSKVSVGAVKIHSGAVRKEERKTKPDRPLKKKPKPDRHLKKNPEPDRPLKNKPEPEPEKNAQIALIKTAHADSLLKTTVSPNKMRDNPVRDPNIIKAMEKGPEIPNTSTDADNTRDFPNTKKTPHQSPMRDILHFGFRFLTVALSCLAIIFAYKAKKMAAMSYQLAVQLQQSIETHRRREFDERY